MSEYQYYEFTAVDKPLNEKEMQSLRNISSRAQITPTSFVNEYHWGDFKGNPLKLVEKYKVFGKKWTRSSIQSNRPNTMRR
ncbi:MAG: hypothetical protein WCB15_18750 [Desulfobacterales bacterium]